MSREKSNSDVSASNSNQRKPNRRVYTLNISDIKPKKEFITFKLCKQECEPRFYNEVKYDKQDRIQNLKQSFLNSQENVKSIDEFGLVYYDDQYDRWEPIDDSDLSKPLGQLKIPENTMISLKIRKTKKEREERSIEIKAQRQENTQYMVKLCIIPKNQKETITISSYSSATVGELRKQIYGRFHLSSKEKPLYIWNDGWILFDDDSNSQKLSDHPWIDGAYISIDLDVDFDLVVVPPGLTGLANLGNTCFINSAIQCLSHTPEFTRQILALSKEINSPILGEYIQLMKQIWSGQNKKIYINELFNNITEALPRYQNHRQHDAQEFMNYFLHFIHEELTEKTTLINELFFGRTRSKVTCLKCQNVERNHDTISFLPVPLQNEKKLETFLLIRSNGELSVHTFVLESSAVRFETLIAIFLEQTKLKMKPEQIQVIELVKNEVREKYSSRKYMDEAAEENLVFREVPKKYDSKHLIECVFYDLSTRSYFRPPVLLACPSKTCLYKDLEGQIDNLRGHLCSLTNATESDLDLYWRNNDGTNFHLGSRPEYKTCLKNIQSICIEMDTKWIRIYRQQYNISAIPEENTLVGLLKDLFSEAPLNGNYRCSKCKQYTTAKQISRLCLPLPPVLIIQLKRFLCQSNVNQKINKFIHFPLEELDLSDYIADDATGISTKYDLVAVSNHSGSMNSGHYTTYAKYITDEQWYHFNDSDVEKLPSSDSVVNKNAYILIYVLRKKKY